MRLALNICFWLVAATSRVTPITRHYADSHPEGVTFRLEGGQNPLVLVPVYLEGKGPYEFILDTGAFRCLLSLKLSTAIGVRSEAHLRATGVGGSMKISSAHLASLAVGSARQNNVAVAIPEELSQVGDIIHGKVDGVLGFNFLKDFRLTLDYQHNVLRVGKSLMGLQNESGLEEAGSTIFKLAGRSKSLILLPVFVNRRGPFQFVLDTGASRTMLSSEIARKLGIVFTSDRHGSGSQLSILTGIADSLSVGNASVNSLSVGVGEFLDMLSVSAGARLDGIVGDDFLSQFEVTIDYPCGTLELNPSAPR